MTAKLTALAITVLAAGCMAEAPPDMMAGPPQPLGAKAAAELDEELRGRTAGVPLTCVESRDIRGSQTIGDRAILFQGRNGNIVYLNQPARRCPGLIHGRTLVTRTFGTRLCAGEIAEIVEPVSGTGVGTCILGEFTPYRR